MSPGKFRGYWFERSLSR